MEFDELHIISDLHLGGEPGFQIFNCADELVALVDQLKGRAAKKQIGLVINGDIVDFLAESPAKYFDGSGAIKKLDRIFGDENFKPVFDALRAFLATRNRYLIVILGNHDIELALPWVREHFVEFITGGDVAVRGRLSLVMDGVGWVAQVAGQRVLCLHGNEVDTWNLVDFEAIRRIGRDHLQGREAEEFVPNAGTQLVIDVMNGIKRRYPFVDLLKPEKDGVVPVLAALDQSSWKRLRKITGVVGRLGWDKVRSLTGFLSTDSAEDSEWPGFREKDDGDRSDLFDELIHETFESSVSDEEKRRWSLLVEAGRSVREGKDPLHAHDAGDDEKLGVAGAMWDWFTAKKPHQVLREALEKLWKDPSFDMDHEDDTFRRIDKHVGHDFEFVVTGHTHLARSIPRKEGRGHYFNTGTWASLIRLEPAMLKSDKAFEPVFEALKQPTLAGIEEVKSGLIKRWPTCVSIVKRKNGVESNLFRVELVEGELDLNPHSTE